MAAPANAEPPTPKLAPVVFEAPAGKRVTGPTTIGAPFDRVLPSGRLVHPTGRSVVVGTAALGFAVAPGGRFAIVANDGVGQEETVSPLDGTTTGGSTLAVVDLATMRVVDRYRAFGESFFAGILACADPANSGGTLVLAAGGPSATVYALDLDAGGRLTPDARPTIAIPSSPDTTLALAGTAFPAALVLAASGARAYVVDTIGDDVAQIDLATRAVVGTPIAVGFFPFGAATSSAGLLVANEGLAAYAKARAPLLTPPFETPIVDPERASSVSFLTAYNDDSLGSVRYAVPLDRGVDGVRAIGGTHPTAIVALRRKPYAFVAMAGVDRIATLSLAADSPRAVGGTELRLYDRGPYGTEPVALAVSSDERRLYVALAGIDAIAVLDIADPLHPHRLGLIPTGWYPSAVAVSPDDRYLYVANTKGYGSDRLSSVSADGSAVWSTFERIDLRTTNLRHTTPLALACLRAIRPAASNRIVPQTFASDGSSLVKHVVVIVQASETSDSMLGDPTTAAGSPHGPGSSSVATYDGVTPNLHALARTYGLAGNMYADAQEAGAGQAFVDAGIATAFTERTLHAGRRAFASRNQDPEDYPRVGYIYNSLALHGKTYRDYGDLLRVSGYDQSAAADPKIDDFYSPGESDETAATQGLGGRYALDVPALFALAGHVDLNYPGYNVRIRDMRRAAEFERDFEPFIRADAMPAFTSVWLPGDGASVADGDRALGRIVAYLTHVPQWSSTAIFILPSFARNLRDRIDLHRTYAIVVSPYAKRGYVGMRHTSTVSVLKTAEELLGLPALSLGDALASDLSDYFTTVPNQTPYVGAEAATQVR